LSAIPSLMEPIRIEGGYIRKMIEGYTVHVILMRAAV